MADGASVFRLFVSSTFSDFTAEREILQREVFPGLREQALAAGARFVPIDLRWGVPREAADQQETMDICLQEIDRCRAEGLPPRLLALVGHRRGWRPLPRSVPAGIWERGAPALTGDARARLECAFWQDGNADPAAWVLRPRDEIIEALSRPRPGPETGLPDPAAASPAGGWDALEPGLRQEVEVLIRAGCADEGELGSLLGSATEQELLRAFGQRGAGLEAVILNRELTAWPRAIDAGQTEQAGTFLELRQDGGAWRPDVEKCHEMERLASKLSGYAEQWAQVVPYKATWRDDCAAVVLSGEQRQGFADLARRHLRRLMAPTLRAERQSGPALREERSHAAIGSWHASRFTGRVGELSRMRQLVPSAVSYRDMAASAPPRPVVIVSGPTGSGRSALMAAAAVKAAGAAASARFAGTTPQAPSAVIARFAGTTPASASAGRLCRSINLELARLLGIGPSHGRRDDLFAIADLLSLAAGNGSVLPARGTLAVFIDNVDWLIGPAGRAGAGSQRQIPAGGLRWLPPAMPPQVTLVLSAHEDNAEALGEWFDACEHVRLGPLSVPDAAAMLDAALRRAGRRLAPEQHSALLAQEPSGWLPLSLNVAAQDAAAWPSWPARDGRRASTRFSEVIAGRLSAGQRHGPVLVASTLGYLLAARDGLAEDELRDVLSRDERVIADLIMRFPFTPLPEEGAGAGRVPDGVLSRLVLDLRPYLLEYPVDGHALLRLAHAEFERHAAQHLASSGEPPATQRHRQLAKYFQGQRRTAGRRPATELGYQLAKAGLWEDLVSLVHEYSFLRALVTGEPEAGTPEAREPGAGRPDDAAHPAGSSWTGAAPLLDLLGLAREAQEAEPAAREAADVLLALWRAVRREEQTLARWPCLFWQQLRNRLAAGPGVPAALRESFEREGDRRPRAWLEMLSAAASPDALAAAHRLSAEGHSVIVTGLVPVRLAGAPREEIIRDSSGRLARWDPTAPAAAPAALRRGGPGLAAVAPVGDGRHVLACDDEGNLELWDVVHGRRRRELAGTLGRGIKAMACFPEERRLVTATDELLTGWEFDATAAAPRLGRRAWPAREPGARWLRALPRGRVLAVGPASEPAAGGPGTGDAWRAVCLSVADGAQQWLHARRAEVHAVAVDPAGRLAALGGADRVTLHDLGTGAAAGAGVGTDSVPTALALTGSGPGAVLLVGREDGWLARHDDLGRGGRGLLPAHAGPVRALAAGPGSAAAASGGADGWVRSWDLDAAEWHGLTAARRVRAAAVGPSGEWVLACCDDGRCYRIDAEGQDWSPVASGTAAEPVLTALPGALGAVISERDGSLDLWQPDGNAVRVLPLAPGAGKVTALAAAADGTRIFAAGAGGALAMIPVGDAAGGATVATAAGRAPVFALAALADGIGVLAGDGSGRLTRWTPGRQDGGACGLRGALQVSDRAVTALAALPGRGTVVAGTQDGDVVLVGEELSRLPEPCGRHGARVTSAVAGLGGQAVVTASGGDEPAICVWDLTRSAGDRMATRLPLPAAPVAVGFAGERPELVVLDQTGRLRRMRLHGIGAGT